MIHALTPDGPKGFILRGIQSPRGKVNVAKVTATTPAGDQVFWDLAGGSAAGFTLAKSRLVVRGATANDGTYEATTEAVTITPSGASGAVTYSWAKTSGEAEWYIERPNSDTTRFTALAVPPEQALEATFTCTATDAAGRQATIDVTAIVTNYGDIRGY